MSLKAIEMQVALPRTHEAGKVLEQMQNRSQVMHDNAAQSVQKEDTQKRTTVTKQEQKEKMRFHHDQSDNQQNWDNQNKKKKQQEQQQKLEKHPYKGNFLDFSG